MKYGVLGGMGPLVSAKFVSDLYNQTGSVIAEQMRPVVLALHQPNFPDRTEAILADRQSELREALQNNLKILVDAGCDKIVVTCFTLHFVFNTIDAMYQSRLFNLLDIVKSSMEKERSYLVLCTQGSRMTKLFDQLKGHCKTLLYPDLIDQAKIHELIYTLKSGVEPASVWQELSSVLKRYKFGGIVSGCTEFYLLKKYLKQYCLKRDTHFIDALREVSYKIVGVCPS